VAFILTALRVAIPTIIGFTLLDSIYYGQLTFTPYNFLMINVLENRSAEFGVSPAHQFFTVFMPKIFG